MLLGFRSENLTKLGRHIECQSGYYKLVLLVVWEPKITSLFISMKYTDIKTLIDPVTLRIQSGDIGAESSLSLTKKNGMRLHAHRIFWMNKTVVSLACRHFKKKCMAN